MSIHGLQEVTGISGAPRLRGGGAVRRSGPAPAPGVKGLHCEGARLLEPAPAPRLTRKRTLSFSRQPAPRRLQHLPGQPHLPSRAAGRLHTIRPAAAARARARPYLAGVPSLCLCPPPAE